MTITVIDYEAMQSALRTRLLTLVVATTGSATLGATTAGYTRATGSFVDEKFVVGMEVAPTGFPQTTTGIVIGVSALLLTIAGGRTPVVAGAGRSLTVGLPSLRAWENENLTPVIGSPYVEEQFDPGPAFSSEVGTAARREARPMYSPRIFAQQNTGIAADGRYADAILNLFPRGLELTCVDGTILCVQSAPAPTRSSRTYARAGWSCIPVNIPLYTLN